MNEQILKALMQLFAIIARVDNVNNNGRLVVQSFLRQQLNSELADQYLSVVFEDYLKSHHAATLKKDGTAKRNSLNSVRILKICNQINSELTQIQKAVVLIRLIELINANEDITEQEFEFVSTVAETFNIEKNEFDDCLNFICARTSEAYNFENTLIIDSETSKTLLKSKHLYSEGITGELRVLQIPSVKLFVLVYKGTSELYLNGHFLTQEKVFILTPGSSIRSSKVKPIYYSDILSTFLSDRVTSKLTFSVSNLEYQFKKGGRLGLRGINFTEESGKLIGIMGGSGAGKSTLLNVLNSNEVPSNGSVKINGINIHTEKHKIEGVIGFVSQDDLLIEELTVFQNLFYNAKLCFGNKSDEEISTLVSTTLSNLGLFETKDLKVGNPLQKTISGGQRKRLNIALELIREPAVLFLDEPTSGLSSRDSENIMDLLKELALKGKLVFVVIHQPSSDIFKMFDQLLILDNGGYPIYFGNPVDSVIYFKTAVNHINCNESECLECGNVNPEQVFNIIESKVLDEYGNNTKNRKISPLEWNARYVKELENKNVLSSGLVGNIPKSNLKIPSRFNQFKIFTARDVISKLTNKQYLAINLLEAPILAFILSYFAKYINTNLLEKTGYVFRENENLPVYIFMSVVVALFIGLTVSAEEIIRDRKIQKRESFLNLSRGSYLWSKIFIMFSLSAIQMFLFVMIGNGILEIKGMTFSYWLILFATSCFANMLGLNVSSAFNSVVTIYILIPFLIIPQLLLSGGILKFDKLNPAIGSQDEVPLIGDLMVSKWAFEALAVKQFKENEYNKKLYKFDKGISIANFKKDYWLPEMEDQLAFCQTYYKNKERKAEVVSALALINNELTKELKNNPDIETELKPIGIETFNEEEAHKITDALTDLKYNYLEKYKEFSTEKDGQLYLLTKDKESKERFLKAKEDYENESLNNMVTNKNSFLKIIEVDGRFIQKSDPIYLDPTEKTGRAHLFAPRKKFFGNYYDTYWFNIAVIALMSLVLGIALYFDLLKKLLGLKIPFGSNKSEE
jgi:ABC-type multidrug transport system ATPase subunit